MLVGGLAFLVVEALDDSEHLADLSRCRGEMMTEINYRGLEIPFTEMGNVTSDDLFGPNEQVIFDFYEKNRERYRRAVDVGANLGVHSILMARSGWLVRAFEPDPEIYAEMMENLEAHNISHMIGAIDAYCGAVSDRGGEASFVRVLNNRTGSHLVGAKKAHGPVEMLTVPLYDCRILFQWADFVKLDCEGHEAAIICAVPTTNWDNADCMLEVGSANAAVAIYRRLDGLVPMWSQRRSWGRVRTLEDMPTHHSEGSLFIGRESPFRESRA